MRAILWAGPFVGAWLFSCTNDFDSFTFKGDPDGGAGTASGGTGNVGGGGASSGGASSGGANTGGGISTGGASTGGTANTGGANTGGAVNTGGTAGCNANQKSCGSQCVTLDNPNFGCAGASCDPCVIANATTQCAQGKCALAKCNTGFGDCNKDLTNGCETNLLTSTAHCGECERACDNTKSLDAGCAQGVCRHRCEAGFADCTQPATGKDDGCETDSEKDKNNCGGCGNDCSQQRADSGFSCKAGACGCTDNKQCEIGGGTTGTCDKSSGLCSCDGASCAPGAACRKSGPNNFCSCNGGAACSAGETCCQTPNTCANLQSDPKNCGGCGTACAAGQTCSAGKCVN